MQSNSINEYAILGGGCFWCLDAAYRLINGVNNVVVGFSGGQVPEPTYEQVVGGQTGHAEVARIEFDLSAISYADILDIFWALHNPTTLNRQGNDAGTQYRSVIFFEDDSQQQVAENSKAEIQKLWPDPVVTEVLPLENFYPAEEYHQNYFAKNPSQGYCQVVINPKLKKLRQKFESKLK